MLLEEGVYQEIRPPVASCSLNRPDFFQRPDKRLENRRKLRYHKWVRDQDLRGSVVVMSCRVATCVLFEKPRHSSRLSGRCFFSTGRSGTSAEAITWSTWRAVFGDSLALARRPAT